MLSGNRNGNDNGKGKGKGKRGSKFTNFQLAQRREAYFKKVNERKPTLGEILNPNYLQTLGGRWTCDPMLREKKVESTNKVKPEVDNGKMGEGLSTTKVVEVKSGETVSKGELTEVANGKMGEGLSTDKVVEVKSGESATSDANVLSRGDNTEVADGKKGETETASVNVIGKGKKKRKRKSKNKQPTLGENLNPQNLETAKGETGSMLKDNPAQQNSGKNQAETININVSGETVNGKAATSVANTVSKGGYTEVANGKTRETETRNINVNGKKKNETKLGVKNKQPTLAEILNPQNFENVKGEMGPVTTTTNDPASRTQKRQKLDKKPDVGDILSTHEKTQDGLSTTKALEVKSGEMVLAETGSLDAIMGLKGDHTVVANGKTEETETTSINVNGVGKKKRRRKSKNKQSALGEDSNPQHLQNLEAAQGERGSGTTSADNPTSETQKTQKFDENPDVGDILSTRENTQEGLSTTKVLEVQSSKMFLTETGSPDAIKGSKGDHTVVATGKMEETETTSINVNGVGKKKRRRKSKNKQSAIGEDSNPQHFAKGERGSGTTSADNPTPETQKTQKLDENPGLGDILSTRENTQEGLSTTKVLEVQSSKMVLTETGSPDANMVSKGDHMVVANGKMEETETTSINVNGVGKNKRRQKSKNKQSALGEDSNPQHLQNLEAAKGERGSGTTSADNPTSETQKTQKLDENPDVGDILSTRENTQEGLSTTKVLEVQSSKMVLTETGSPDANMVSKGDHTDVANGKIGESETTNVNVNGKEINKNKLNSNNKRLTLGEILNPQHLQNLEAAKGEAGSGTTSTSMANRASKRRKREETKNNNSDLGDVISTHESTQEGLSTNQVLEVKNGETICGKTATPDANMVSIEDHTEVENGKTGESETTNVNLNGKKKRRKPKSKKKQPNLGETLNSQHLELLEASDGATNSKYSEKGNSQDAIIMNKGPGTAEPEERDPQEIFNVEKCRSTIADAENTMLKNIVRPQVAKSELGSTTIVLKSSEPADLKITEAKANEALARKEITQVATLGKKLIILDVNGLLADVTSLWPTNTKADNYIRKKTIFKRPYLDEFLSFCFERFNVAIWSSRRMTNLRPVVDYLLRDLKEKLLFMWDGSKCTYSGVGTLENRNKMIIMKDLKKIWDKDGPNNAWVKGTFHESNTLLVDDSPYKALLNPKHTGIFPASYSYMNKDDNFLAPKGDLQNYLEGLAAADDVKTYVEQHPFGQVAIDEQSPHWEFYLCVLDRLSGRNRNREREWLARQKCQNISF